MNESAVKTKMVKLVKERGGYARRIEDQYGVGILDTILIPPRCPVFFCEVKIIRDNMFGPTERQWVEMDRIESVLQTDSYHCHAILIGYKAGVYYFHEHTQARKVDRRACFSVTTSDWHFVDQLQAFYNARLK